MCDSTHDESVDYSWEIPAAVAIKVVLQDDEHATVFGDCFRIYSTGFSFSLSMVLPWTPRLSMEYEDSETPDFRGQPGPAAPYRDAYVAVNLVGQDYALTNESDGDDRLALLRVWGRNRRWEARFWAPIALPTMCTLRVSWPYHQLDCSANFAVPDATADVVTRRMRR